MGLFASFFSSKAQEKKSDKVEVFPLIGGLKFQLRIAGEEYHQNALESICGPHRRGGVNRLETAWLIVGDENNPNKDAVRVAIHGKPVGYLPPQAAISYRQKLFERNTPTAVGRCQAMIKGGWISSDGRKGLYEVWLDAPSFVSSE
jgi:hypothetical protein